MYARLRPALFRLPADRAHDLARLALRLPAPFRLLGRTARLRDPRLSIDLAGVPLSSPVGLAPGFDKDGDLLASLQHLGFGYVVIGSLTPEARAGNPRPRLVRYPERLSVANSMGLPNRGVDAAVRRLRSRPVRNTTVLASVAGFSIESILASVGAIEPLVAAVKIAGSSVRTPPSPSACASSSSWAIWWPSWGGGAGSPCSSSPRPTMRRTSARASSPWSTCASAPASTA